jgi:hypothetical protein
MWFFWMAYLEVQYICIKLCFAKNADKKISVMPEMLKTTLSGLHGSNMETSVDFEHSGFFPQIAQMKIWR